MASVRAVESSPAPATPLSGAAALLRDALDRVPEAADWAVWHDYRVLRLGCRIDAVVVTPGAVLVLRIAMTASRFTAADRNAVADAALDLADFHAGCRGLPVVPILVVPNGDRPSGVRPLPLHGVASLIETTRLLLPGVLQELARFPAVPNIPPPGEWDQCLIGPCLPWSTPPACYMRATTLRR